MRRRGYFFGALIALIALIGGVWLGGPALVDTIGGNFAGPPQHAYSAAAQQLIDRAYQGIDPPRLLDHHVHLVGIGAGGTGARANERMMSWWYPRDRFKLLVYMSASGVDSLETADQVYVERLNALIDALPHPTRHLLLAFDAHHAPSGELDWEHTEFYTPNEYLFQIVARHPQRFLPMISVHPYRKNAVEELRAGHARGARYVKWLPNAMNIDPCDAQVDPFYDEMRKLGMVLLTHAGEEKAVHAEDAQKLGNPLLLRRALNRGVRVIVAHCASLGDNVDLDSPSLERRDNLTLFLRLMDEYPGLAFGEISATVLRNRASNALPLLLARKELHPRLVNGTDYPLPAVDYLIDVEGLAGDGFLPAADVPALEEIYAHNPILFDFVLKRALGFPPAVFMENAALTSTVAPALPDRKIDDRCAADQRRPQ